MDTTTRDARGRFTPGRSGNPKGRPLGSLNKTTRLERALDDPDADVKQTAAALAKKAADGNVPAIRVLLDRLDPKPKSPARAITIAIDPGASLPERLTAVFNATVRGEINPEEALQLAQLLDRITKAEVAAHAAMRNAPEYREYWRWRDARHAAEQREAAARQELEIAAAREAEVRRAAEADGAAAPAPATDGVSTEGASTEGASTEGAPTDDAAPPVSSAADAPEPERRRDPSEYALPLPPGAPAAAADLLYSTSISRPWHGKARYGERPRGPDGAPLKRPRRRMSWTSA